MAGPTNLQVLLGVIAAVAVLALVLAIVAVARVGVNPILGAIRPAGLLQETQPVLMAYAETWQRGNPVYQNPANAPTGPYGAGSLSTYILAFCNLSFTKVGGNILIGGLNATNADPYYDGGTMTLQNFINAVKANNTKVWVSLGGATIQAAALDNLVPLDVVSATTQYGINGWDVDFEAPYDAKDFFNKMQALQYAIKSASSLTTLCLDVEGTQVAQAKNNKYAYIFPNGGNGMFDFLSIQAYNFCYPTDVTAAINSSVPGDIPVAIQTYGFHPSQIILGINPGLDECSGGGFAFRTSDAQAAATYVKNNGLGGMFIWSAQRDSVTPLTGESDSTNIIAPPNLWFAFGTGAGENGIPWNAPWPAANQNVTDAGGDGLFAQTILDVFRA